MSLLQVPGDDAPVVWGICGHAFHLQCINKCLATQEEQRCPFCRRHWEFKTAEAAPTPGGPAQAASSSDTSTEPMDDMTAEAGAASG